MDVSDAKALLQEHGDNIIQQTRLGNDSGMQLRTKSGAIVNVYDKGTVSVQGKNAAVVKAYFEGPPPGIGGLSPKEVLNKVFVVYGHDEQSKLHLEAMLRRWGLEPLILDQLPSEGQTIIEKLEAYTSKVQFAVVLATPDDEGHRAEHPDEKKHRARQNVVLELGMLLAVLGRKRVAVLLRTTKDLERPSDIQGLIYIPYKDDLQKEAGLLLCKEMAAIGYSIDISKV